MAILQFTPILVGQVGMSPGNYKGVSDDTVSDITSANYLAPLIRQGYQFSQGDNIEFTHSSNRITTNFSVNISVGTITLIPTSAEIVLPVTLGNIPVFDGASGSLANGPVSGNKILTSSIVTPDVSLNLVPFKVTVGQAALASAGSVTLIDSSGTKQYSLWSLQLDSGGTNFSGGGGNRLGQVTDGTTVYSVIPAATMQTLANTQWGATGLPNAASAANSTATVAGTDLVFKYSGGTTDYTAGSLVIRGLAQRIA